MKKRLANLIWNICRKGPEAGNRVMDISYKMYYFAMINHTN